MTDAHPSDIAQFRILEVLGEGGMGVVYRAVDRKLQRTVALKVLAPELTRDEGRRARVLTEARAAAAIDHPSIATVYEIGEHDDAVYIAMELVKGHTLLERIQRDGPLPLSETLDIAIDVAAALAEAHASGVIHRDLKDDNIMLGASGEVRLVDFGLAKMQGGRDLDVLEEADTEVPASRGDVAVGTPGFIAPEQAKNHAVDERVDIFSLGVVLTRVTTGKLPFDGASPFELVIAPMHDDPDLTGVPPELKPVVTRCLQRRREDRYPSAAELLADLQRLRDELRPDEPPPRAPTSRKPLAPLALVATAAIAGTLAWRSQAPAPEPPAPAASAPAPETTPTNLELKQVTTESADAGAPRGAISPDGLRVAFAHAGGLFVREIEGGKQRRIVDNADDRLHPLAWWRDGIVCATGGEAPSIVVQPLDGGAARTLAEPAFFAAVSPDDQRVALATADGVRLTEGDDSKLLVPLPRVDAQELGLLWNAAGDRLMLLRPQRGADGDSVRVETLALDAPTKEPTLAFEDRALAGQTAYGAAVWLPDGRLVVSLTEPPPDNLASNLWETVVDPATGKASGPLRRLTRWPSAGLWYMTLDRAGKRLLLSLFKSSITLMTAALRFDGTLAGPPTALESDLSLHWPSGWRDAQTVIYTSNRSGRLDVFTHRLDEPKPEPLLATEHHDTYALAAGDELLHFRAAWNDEANAVESRLLRTAADGTSSVLFEAPPEPARFTFGSASPIHTGLRCTPDGKRCVVGSKRGDRFVVRDLDGDAPRAELPAQGGLISWDLSPDGEVVTVMEARLDHATSSIAWFEDDPKNPRHIELDRSCSPTGLDWVSRERAYLSCYDPGGHVLLHVEATGRTTQIHQAPAHSEMWQPLAAPDAKHLVYRQDAVAGSLWLVEGF